MNSTTLKINKTIKNYTNKFEESTNNIMVRYKIDDFLIHGHIHSNLNKNFQKINWLNWLAVISKKILHKVQVAAFGKNQISIGSAIILVLQYMCTQCDETIFFIINTTLKKQVIDPFWKLQGHNSKPN
ncbi:hypothetical protein ACTA71_003883 [Dictyostelium dimigraforme]